MACCGILLNLFEEQWTQNHPQYFSGMLRKLFETTSLEIAVDCEQALHLWKVARKQHTREHTKEREGAGHSRVRSRFSFLVTRKVRVESLSRAGLYLYIQWISTFVSELLKSLVYDLLTPRALCLIQGVQCEMTIFLPLSLPRVVHGEISKQKMQML